MVCSRTLKRGIDIERIADRIDLFPNFVHLQFVRADDAGGRALGGRRQGRPAVRKGNVNGIQKRHEIGVRSHGEHVTGNVRTNPAGLEPVSSDVVLVRDVREEGGADVILIDRHDNIAA